MINKFIKYYEYWFYLFCRAKRKYGDEEPQSYACWVLTFLFMALSGLVLLAFDDWLRISEGFTMSKISFSVLVYLPSIIVLLLNFYYFVIIKKYINIIRELDKYEEKFTKKRNRDAFLLYLTIALLLYAKIFFIKN